MTPPIKNIANYLPARVTLRGDWENRQLWADDVYLNPDIATRAFPSLHMLPAQQWALMVLVHYLPVHLVAEAIGNMSLLNVIGSQMKNEDFEITLKLRHLAAEAHQNDKNYAY